MPSPFKTLTSCGNWLRCRAADESC